MTIIFKEARRQILATGASIFLFFFLVYFIATYTLSFAIRRDFSKTAVNLNSHNVAALLFDASQQAVKLAHYRIERAAGSNENEQKSKNEESPESDFLKATVELREALKSEPINASALRLIGQAEFINGNPQQGRLILSKASDLSSHEIIAHDFMFKNSVDEEKYVSAMAYADRLFSAAPDLLNKNDYMFERLLHNVDARNELLKVFLDVPSWRPHFFASVLPKLSPSGLQAASFLVDSLSSDGQGKISNSELNAALNAFVAKKQFELAYATWLSSLSPERSDIVDLLNNGSFETDPSGAPFDWNIRGGVEAKAKIGSISGHGGRALHIEFGHGRVVFPNVYEYTMLVPGYYHFQAEYKGDLVARRGLQWLVSCADSRRAGESEMILGLTYRWQKIHFEFSIPEKGCETQRVSLIHNARSPSEQIISGSAWFDNLSIVRADKDN